MAGGGRRTGCTLALLLWSGLAGAATDCNVEWNLSTRGMPLGVARDHVVSAPEGSITVSSAFAPSSLLAMFGVDPGTREMVFDATRQARQRTETRSSSTPEVNVWRRSEGIQWLRSLNGAVDKQWEMSPDPVVDSTSFPYLLLLGLLPEAPPERSVNVVSKGKIYPATLQLEPVSGAAPGFRLGFRSKEANASALLDAAFRPVRFEFTDEHGTLKGERSAWTCR